MPTIHSRDQMETLHARMRTIRISRNLTLSQAASLSGGELSAIALGSYERGDRSVTASKLIAIAAIHQVPVAELFEPAKKYNEKSRITIDIRKILLATDPVAITVTSVLRSIARMRGDWNGEVISLRADDINNLSNFTGLGVEQIQSVTQLYAVTRSK
jgi:transcriptional regulator with XRE-family HTH domain